MNKIKKWSFISLTAAILGAVAIGVFSLNKNTATQEASAARDTEVNGVYKRVTDPSKLQNGDRVLLQSETKYVLRDIGGNPGYLTTTSDHVYTDANGVFTWLDAAYLTELIVHTKTVTYEGQSITVYAFEGNFLVNGSARENSAYLAYDDRGSNPSHPGHPSIGGVGYFKDYLGARAASELGLDECWWRLHYVEGSGVMDILNLKTGGHICHGGDRWGTYFHWADWSNVNLFKSTSILHVVPDTTDVNKLYNQGDEFDLSGLEVEVTFGDNSKATISYNGQPHFFVHSKYVVGTGEKTQPVSFVNQKSFNITVNITPSWEKFYHVDSNLPDYRGTYALAYQTGEYDPVEPENYNAVAFNARSGEPISSTDIDGGVLSFRYSYKKADAMFYLTYLGSSYRMFYLDGNDEKMYVGAGSDGSGNPIEGLSFKNTIYSYNAIDVRFDGSGYAYLGIKNTDLVLCSNGDFTTENITRYQLFKEKLTDADYTTIETFKKDFTNATKTCDETNENGFYITSNIWVGLANNYLEYSLNVKGYLGCVTYVHNDPNNDELQNLIDRYDYIYTKYHETHNYITDFLGRASIMGTYQSNQLPIVTNTDMIPAIVIIAVSSVTLIVGFVVLRKKRQNRV